MSANIGGRVFGELGLFTRIRYLTPPGAQYGAMQGKAETRNRLIYAEFATLSKPLQHMNYHS
jgi:hypothetical protein